MSIISTVENAEKSVFAGILFSFFLSSSSVHTKTTLSTAYDMFLMRFDIIIVLLLHSVCVCKVQAAKGIMEDPAQARQALKEAEKAMREVTSNTTTAAQEGSGSITSSFERFKRALREEVERDLRGGRKGRRK